MAKETRAIHILRRQVETNRISLRRYNDARTNGCEIVARAGERAVQWDVNSTDAFAKSPKSVASTVIREAQAGSIIVMHFNGAPNAPVTAEALQALIPELRGRGFEFARLDTLLGGP